MLTQLHIIQRIQNRLRIRLVQNNANRFVFIEIVNLTAEGKHRAILHLIDKRMFIDAEPDHFTGGSLQLMVPIFLHIFGINHIHIVSVIIDLSFICNDMDTYEIIPRIKYSS
ncbi:hypothetical protein D3C71_1433270 [compost metagenome]